MTSCQLCLVRSQSTWFFRSGAVSRLVICMYLGSLLAALLFMSIQQWSLLLMGESCIVGLYSEMFVRIRSSLACSLVLKSTRLRISSWVHTAYVFDGQMIEIDTI